MKNTSKTDYEKLKNMSDEDIDYSDINETNEEFWQDAEIIHPHKKVAIQINIDEDIALWLKQLGAESSITINRMLRNYYLTVKHLQSK